ncbi:hypothetical protein [Chryseobacterium viscerum]|uniref:Uncharacterized protein n=1 Tax=Chryseobacterium viscerum TaxID=1037377 RepID=A0A316WGB3_9FLAO|nr:hypothetical protein [Chryseobacterium viscerum]PWN60447.1 hypothetical protein C1634_016010 [Chryseobacterium viscerum]
MKYYIIQESLNLKIVGSFPQTNDAKHNCDIWSEPKFIEHQELNKLDFIPITSNAILRAKSKLTDLISTSGIGFTRKLLVSGKLKSIIELHANPDVQYFEAPIIHNNNFISDYYVLYVNKAGFEFLDFVNCDFYLMDGLFDEKQKLTVNNYEDFLMQLKSIEVKGWPNNMKIKKIKIIEGAVNFLALKNVEGGIQYLVSETLKNEIEDAGCTGIEFQPSELSYNEWTISGGERERIYGKS